MKQRNCADNEYEETFFTGGFMVRKLIAGTMLLVTCLMAGSLGQSQELGNFGSTKASLAKYPPYPDVWDWKGPNRDKMSQMFSTMLMLSNGDVLYLYENLRKKERLDKSTDVSEAGKTVPGRENEAIGGRVTVFGGQTLLGNVSNLSILRGQAVPLNLDDGTKVWPLRRGDFVAQGATTEIRNIESVFGDSQCRWPVDILFLLNELDKPRHAKKFAIFKILKKPEIVNVSQCQEYAETRLVVRFKNVGGAILALNDGTFLIEIEPGILMRFDHNFQTKSNEIDTTYFILEQKQSGRLLINEFTNKDYGENIQEAFDDLYRYLLARRQGGK